LSNLGGTFPKFFVLKLIDMLTVATCVPPTTPPAAGTLKGAPVTSPFSCVAETEKHRCTDGGGACTISTDGYYLVNVLCVAVGALLFWSFIGPAAKRLQGLPLRAWRLGPDGR
jgi:MFS transporter, PAT family, solute carrier family 33 (acetyl-CoA transportor), member 1